MIAIDTNVLLRYLLEDDRTQALKARKLISDNETVLITDVVLVETIWTLKGKKYQLKRPEIINLVQALFEEASIIFENAQVIWIALNDYRKASPLNGKRVDFSDALILSKANYIASLQSKDLNGFYTFDKSAQQLPGAEAP